MEKERVFRERFIQHKTSEAFRDAAKQANWSVSNESKIEFFSDLENTAP